MTAGYLYPNLVLYVQFNGKTIDMYLHGRQKSKTRLKGKLTRDACISVLESSETSLSLTCIISDEKTKLL